jgi:hypothetical protein
LLANEGCKPVGLEIADIFHYGMFLSYICQENPGMYEQFEEEIVDNVRGFFSRLFEAHTATPDSKIVLNTGNWEESTPIDCDASGDLTHEVKKPLNERVSNSIRKICESYETQRVIYNDGVLHLDNTIIVGATAVLDAAAGKLTLGVKAGQLISHFPHDYRAFPDFTPKSTDVYWAKGMQLLLRQAGAEHFVHGHVHGNDNYSFYNPATNEDFYGSVEEDVEKADVDHYLCNTVKVGCGCHHIIEL